jgi:hypothetical protein
MHLLKGLVQFKNSAWETRVPALLKVPIKLFTIKAPFLNVDTNRRVYKNYPFCDFETTNTSIVL